MRARTAAVVFALDQEESTTFLTRDVIGLWLGVAPITHVVDRRKQNLTSRGAFRR
jgi:hypothetical protein